MHARTLAVVLCLAGCAAAGCVEKVELRSRAAAEPDAAAEVGMESGGAGGEAPLAGTPDDDGFGDTPDPGERGCSRIDFLFVIDNSISMVFAQNKLRDSFPAFMAVVQNNVTATDYHIMVVDTDSWDGLVGDPSDDCREALGAGRRADFTGQDCGLPDGRRYITSSEPNLTQTFACLANVGAFGDPNEQPIDAMLQALSPAQNATGGCNTGFLRRDAILVVTLITNQDDESSIGAGATAPETWQENLLALKGGDPGALVLLSFVADNNLDPPLPGGPCTFLDLGTSGAPRLQRFTRGLERNSLVSVCANDYAPFFESVVGSIGSACEAFVIE
jgi:hypothetical protein